MKRLQCAIALSVALAHASIAGAAMPPTLLTPTGLTNVAINAACNANPHLVATASLTCAAAEIKTDTVDEIRVNVLYTYDSATAVQLWIDGSDSDTGSVGGTPFFTEGNGDTATAPYIEMAPQYINFVTSAAGFAQTFVLTGPFPRWTRFRVTSTGGTSSDKVTVTLELR